MAPLSEKSMRSDILGGVHHFITQNMELRQGLIIKNTRHPNTNKFSIKLMRTNQAAIITSYV